MSVKRAGGFIFGQLSGVCQCYFLGTLSRGEFNSALTQYVLYFVYLAIGEFFTIYTSMVGFIHTSEYITRKTREQYLSPCLRQNMGFFDVVGAGELTARLTAYTSLIQDGISEKVGLSLSTVAAFVSAFVIGFVIGFVKYWKLALILASTVVATTLTMAGISKFIVRNNKKSLEAYAVGGSVAEEVLRSVYSATTLGTQDKFAQKYDRYLIQAERWGFKVKLTFSIMIGTISLVMYLSYGLAFWPVYILWLISISLPLLSLNILCSLRANFEVELIAKGYILPIL